MVADKTKALRLLLCITGLLNDNNASNTYANDSYIIYRG